VLLDKPNSAPSRRRVPVSPNATRRFRNDGSGRLPAAACGSAEHPPRAPLNDRGCSAGWQPVCPRAAERPLTGSNFAWLKDRSWPFSDVFSARKPPVSATNPGLSASGKYRPTAVLHHSLLSGRLNSANSRDRLASDHPATVGATSAAGPCRCCTGTPQALSAAIAMRRRFRNNGTTPTTMPPKPIRLVARSNVGMLYSATKPRNSALATGHSTRITNAVRL
jgi:hypothetical protein